MTITGAPSDPVPTAYILPHSISTPVESNSFHGDALERLYYYKYLLEWTLKYHIGAPFCTIKIYSESSRLIVVKITVKHGEAP